MSKYKGLRHYENMVKEKLKEKLDENHLEYTEKNMEDVLRDTVSPTFLMKIAKRLFVKKQNI